MGKEDTRPSPPPPYEFNRCDTRTSDQNATTVLSRDAIITMSNGLNVQVADPPGHQSQPVAALIAVTVAGPSPVLIQCPFCCRVIATECRPQTGCLIWLSCAVCLALGCWFGCCLIPFCSRALRDVRHVCPHCHQTVAIYKRL